MVEARLDEGGEAPVRGEQDEDRHGEATRLPPTWGVVPLLISVSMVDNRANGPARRRDAGWAAGGSALTRRCHPPGGKGPLLRRATAGCSNGWPGHAWFCSSGAGRGKCGFVRA